MITKAQVMPLLVEACPSFSETWKEHRDYWGEEELLYIDLGEFAQHLVNLYVSGRSEEFAPVFNVVERLHNKGDSFVREAATIGLLEGIQNIAGNSGIDPENFVRHLGPQSKEWWKRLNNFWSGKTRHV